MKENFKYLLSCEKAVQLYKQVKNDDIYDYHCHLSPKEIFEDNEFDNIGEMWLAGDHYKWRLMRAAGAEEKYVTGDASWHDKFIKFAESLNFAAGSHVYHWAAMELSMYFGIDYPLNSSSAEEIWETANRVIKDEKLSPRKLMQMSGVKYVATTDNITDNLEFHEKIKADDSFDIAVTPSFRTDALFGTEKPEYQDFIALLSKTSGSKIVNLCTLEQALINRLDFFVSRGCKFTDVGLSDFPSSVPNKEQAELVFAKALNAEDITAKEKLDFVGYMFVFLGIEYGKRDLVMQWHMSPLRNVNSKLFKAVGPDSGGDCIGDEIGGYKIAQILDEIHKNGTLPKTVLYSLNANMNAKLVGIAGSFPNVVCGTSWWYNDNKRGIREMMETVSEMGYIGSFLGMLTDSRSFLSYARHDYFRRIAASMIGEFIQRGEYSEDFAVELLHKISYKNIEKWIYNKS